MAAYIFKHKYSSSTSTSLVLVNLHASTCMAQSICSLGTMVPTNHVRLKGTHSRLSSASNNPLATQNKHVTTNWTAHVCRLLLIDQEELRCLVARNCNASCKAASSLCQGQQHATGCSPADPYGKGGHLSPATVPLCSKSLPKKCPRFAVHSMGNDTASVHHLVCATP
jgi:hypothetical protein